MPPYCGDIPAEAGVERSSGRDGPGLTLVPGPAGHRRQKSGDGACPGAFGVRLKALRESAGFTQEELATIAGLSIHAVSALERGERRRPHVETVRALSAALDLTGSSREVFLQSARAPAQRTAFDELSGPPLPLALTPLIGRDDDVRTLCDWLGDHTVRLVTLVGPGGAGKTRLALETGHAIASAGRTRVSCISLAAVRDCSSVASAIAEALGLADVAPGELPNRIRLACAGHPALLILDNFEQVLDAAPLVADLLASVAPLRLLVTSRSPLRIRGEREYTVGPLDVTSGERATSPAEIVQSPAIRLFVERARAVRPDFCVTSSNGGAIVDICRRLDGLPLALELAAPWIKVLTVEDLLRRLTRDVLLSTAGPRDLPERQQTINATIAWSYNLLSPNEQRAFRRLGALTGPFAMEAAAGVLAGRDGYPGAADEALCAVAGLLDKSLLMRAANSAARRPVYRMLETVRAYAALELAAAGEYDDALEGLVRYSTRQAGRVRADGVLAHTGTRAGGARLVRTHAAPAVPFGDRGVQGARESGAHAVSPWRVRAGSGEPRARAGPTSELREAGLWFLVPVVNVRAILAVRRGRPDDAIALVRESLLRIRELHDKFAFVYATVPLAAAAR